MGLLKRRFASYSTCKRFVVLWKKCSVAYLTYSYCWKKNCFSRLPSLKKKDAERKTSNILGLLFIAAHCLGFYALVLFSRRVGSRRSVFFLVSSSFRSLEEEGRGANSILPSSFKEEQHPVLPPTVVVLPTNQPHWLLMMNN